MLGPFLFVMATMTELLVREVAADVVCPTSSKLSTSERDRLPNDVNVPGDIGEGLARVRESFFAQCRARGIAEPERFIEEVFDNAKRCVLDNLDPAEIGEDISNHMQNGGLNVLFSSRCRDLPPKMLDCADQRLAELECCLNETERAKDYRSHMMAGLRAAIDFLCYKEGEHIAIFLSEKGQECVTANATRDGLLSCMRAHNLTAGVTDKLADLVHGFSEENCRHLFVAHECVSDALKHCDDPTPSNVVDSLLRAFEKPLPCRRTSNAPTAPLTTCLMLLLFTVAALLLGRLS